jgi:uridine nucleosidase
MGGAIGNGFTSAPMGMVEDQLRFGNWTPYAGKILLHFSIYGLTLLEFNIVVDPEASQILLENVELAVKTILIPLDVTHQVLATPTVQDLLLYGPSRKEAESPSTLRVMLLELMKFFEQTYADVFGITEGPPYVLLLLHISITDETATVSMILWLLQLSWMGLQSSRFLFTVLRKMAQRNGIKFKSL